MNSKIKPRYSPLERISKSLYRFNLGKLSIVRKDFYLSPAGLAAYFEKEWSDLLLSPEKMNFDFAPFELKHLSRGDSKIISQTILEIANKESFRPKSYLEIGPGLGRAFYEIMKETPSLRSAKLVEPSKYLAKTLENLFLGKSSCAFPIILGNDYLSEIKIEPTTIREKFDDFDLEIINKTFDNVTGDVETSDLVLCLNVVDQCKDPEALLDLVKAKTNSGGVLVVSCTFQWQKRFLGSKIPFTNLRTEFGEDWEVLADENLPFSIRVNERYWYTFLSQVLYLKRKK